VEIHDYKGWEKVRPLGEGGQSEVFLVRNPQRVRERQKNVADLRLAFDNGRFDEFANLSWSYARPEDDAELGALKVFKIPIGNIPKDQEVRREAQRRGRSRFQNELAMLKKKLPGLPKLLAYSEDRFWIITEYFREGSLEKQLTKFKGNALVALLAFRSLGATVKTLHDQEIVHRDIKPANVFVRTIDELILGDLGIVFLPDAPSRPTEFGERVGPRDFMAPWLDTGERVDEVTPAADVYMLGKLLWCMASDRPKLLHYPRANHDLTKLFPDSEGMESINLIVEKCVVMEEHLCLQSAGELLVLVDETIKRLQKGEGHVLPNGRLNLTCHMCGRGKYKPQGKHFILPLFYQGNSNNNNAVLHPFVCDVCSHFAIFAPGEPEGAERKWRST
jgi:serine/threonine protein kinase